MITDIYNAHTFLQDVLEYIERWIDNINRIKYCSTDEAMVRCQFCRDIHAITQRPRDFLDKTLYITSTTSPNIPLPYILFFLMAIVRPERNGYPVIL